MIKETYKYILENSLKILKKEDSYYGGGAAMDGKEEMIEDCEQEIKQIEAGTFEPTVEDFIDLFYIYELILIDNKELLSRAELERRNNV